MAPTTTEPMKVVKKLLKLKPDGSYELMEMREVVMEVYWDVDRVIVAAMLIGIIILIAWSFGILMRILLGRRSVQKWLSKGKCLV